MIRARTPTQGRRHLAGAGAMVEKWGVRQTAAVSRSPRCLARGGGALGPHSRPQRRQPHYPPVKKGRALGEGVSYPQRHCSTGEGVRFEPRTVGLRGPGSRVNLREQGSLVSFRPHHMHVIIPPECLGGHKAWRTRHIPGGPPRRPDGQPGPSSLPSAPPSIEDPCTGGPLGGRSGDTCLLEVLACSGWPLGPEPQKMQLPDPGDCPAWAPVPPWP